MDNKELILLSDEDARAIEVLEKFIGGRKKGVLADEYGVSYNTIKRWIERGTKILKDELEERADHYYALIFQKYSWILDEAQIQYTATRDVKFLAEMRATMAEMRRMLALDKPENKKPSVQIGNLIFQMNTENYEKAEQKMKELVGDNDIIEGESREV